uniref:Uncharacterized protein n=1 Tax=Arundo donax TaxID=35708 RepID=A0A0A8Z8G7_ARUDO
MFKFSINHHALQENTLTSINIMIQEIEVWH